MSRKRYVSSKMCVNSGLAGIGLRDERAVLMWPWFLLAFDDWARAKFDPVSLKLSLFPALDHIAAADIERAIDLYAAHGLLHLYEIDGQRYIAIEPDIWFKEQSYITTTQRVRGSSHCPAPPAPPWGNEVLPRDAASRPIREAIPNPIRFQVLQRDGFKCRYCGAAPPNVKLHVDHAVPVSQGGDNDPSNLVTACSQCNFGKGRRLLRGRR